MFMGHNQILKLAVCLQISTISSLNGQLSSDKLKLNQIRKIIQYNNNSIGNNYNKVNELYSLFSNFWPWAFFRILETIFTAK